MKPQTHLQFESGFGVGSVPRHVPKTAEAEGDLNAIVQKKINTIPPPENWESNLGNDASEDAQCPGVVQGWLYFRAREREGRLERGGRVSVAPLPDPCLVCNG